jgi:hypothetical protein
MKRLSKHVISRIWFCLDCCFGDHSSKGASVNESFWHTISHFQGYPCGFQVYSRAQHALNACSDFVSKW